MKGITAGIALAFAGALMAFSPDAHAYIEGTPCTEGQENARVPTGMYGYRVYQCQGVWVYLYECDESGYCFIAG